MAVTYFRVFKAAKQGTCLLSLLHRQCAHILVPPGQGCGGGLGWGSCPLIGALRGQLQQAPSGPSLLRSWAHRDLSLRDGVPRVAGWSPALGAAATGGGDWMPGESVPPKVRLISSCESEVDTQNKPPSDAHPFMDACGCFQFTCIFTKFLL